MLLTDCPWGPRGRELQAASYCWEQPWLAASGGPGTSVPQLQGRELCQHPGRLEETPEAQMRAAVLANTLVSNK